MKSRLWHRRTFTSRQWILVLTLAAFPFGNIVADDAPFGIYSGECTLNGEPMRVELEIVRNEMLSGGGADGILSLVKSGERSPAARVTMRGGFRDVRQPRLRGDRSPLKTKRQFDFSAMDASAAFGGRFSLNLEEEGGALKGTLFLEKKEPPPGYREQLAVTLIRSMTAQEHPTVSAPPAREAEIDSNDITGVYDGTLTAEKRQFFAQLRLNREGANDLLGVLSFSASAGDTEPLGSFKLKGKFDPVNTFQLSSGGELTSSDGLILAAANGNFDPASGKLRAQLTPNGGILELTRNVQETAKLQAKSSAAAKQLKEGPASLDEAKTDEERRVVIVRWFSRLKREYPDIDLHHTVLNEIYPKILNLFGDDDFVPIFGKPFDAMSMDDRNYVKELFRRLFMGRETRDLLDGFGSFLERPFVLPQGSFSYADVAPQLAFRRTVRKRWHETMDRLKSLSPTSADYDELLAMEKKGTEPFKDLWPSEFKQFQEAVESTKHRLADGAASGRLDKVLTDATGLDGARLLSDWVDEQVELLKYVSEDARPKLKSRINQKADELLGEPLRKEADSLARLGEGIEAVRAGKTWYRDLRKTYGFARESASFQGAVARLQARRGADLEAAAPAIVAEISVQSTARGLYDVIESYLGVPGDSKTTPGANIAQAVAERKKVIPPEAPGNPELTNEQKIWATIGAIFAGAVVLDALAGPHQHSDSGDIPRERPKCSMCGGSGVVPSQEYNGPIVGNYKVCPACGGSGLGW